MNNDDLDVLLSDWSFWASKGQREPEDDWRLWFIFGERASGKTRTASEWVRSILLKSQEKIIGLFAQTKGNVHNNMLGGSSGILRYPLDKIIIERSDFCIRFNTGSIIYVFSYQNLDKVRGYELDYAWADEWLFCKKSNNLIYNLNCAVRRSANARIVFTTTSNYRSRSLQYLKDFPRSCFSYLRRADNRANLYKSSGNMPEFFERKYQETNIHKEDNIFPLLDPEDIIHSVPDDIEECVIGLDPCISEKDGSSLFGIVICSVYRGNYYVVDDCTEYQTNLIKVARRIKKIYTQHSASYVIIEVNQGGAFIKNFLLRDSTFMRCYEVRAKRSKIERIMPIVSLYKERRIFHIKTLRDLEQDLTHSFVVTDRLDALVWAIWFLERRKVFNKGQIRDLYE